MEKQKKLVIVGAGEFGQIAYEYFTYDSEYDVVAFAVEKEYRDIDFLFGLPVVDLEDCKNVYPPSEYEVFIAITFVQLNRARAKIFQNCKRWNYRCASYISSRAFVWHNTSIGENVFVFENSTIQHKAKVGNNVIIWSGSTIAHQTIVDDNCWLAPNCAIAGFCHIGENCFIGTNATLGDNVVISADTVLGAGTVVVKSINDAGNIFVGNPARKLDRTSYQKFNVLFEKK